MKVYTGQTGLFSPAMERIERALNKFSPPRVTIVKRKEDADLIVFYTICPSHIDISRKLGKDFAVVQCCIGSSNVPDAETWEEFWQRSRAVWSYYPLDRRYSIDRFYFAPLGVDPAFCARQLPSNTAKRNIVLTTGCVNGPSAEALDDVWRAARAAGVKSVHVGPTVVQGARYRADETVTGISDEHLANLYAKAKYVCALRYIEGFELPAAEGLACGARPVLFDQPALKHWYGSSAVYVPELAGPDLVQELIGVFSTDPVPVSRDEHHSLLNRFNWENIARGFWRKMGVQ